MPARYLEPSSKGKRGELDNSRSNGRVVNPPRFAQLGGLSSAKKSTAMRKGDATIRKPGSTVV